MIAGLDEVGRGSWAGPLVACAVIFPTEFSDESIVDSKQLTLLKRKKISDLILSNAIAVGVGWSSPRLIDEHGLTKATTNAMNNAYKDLRIKAKQIHIDGNFNYLPQFNNVKTFVKGDQSKQHIAAASIIAKVKRDNFMRRMDRIYPGYGFITNVGYGSNEHKKALTEKGITPLHRKTWKPLLNLS